jgi:hypothetical protein
MPIPKEMKIAGNSNIPCGRRLNNELIPEEDIAEEETYPTTYPFAKIKTNGIMLNAKPKIIPPKPTLRLLKNI